MSATGIIQAATTISKTTQTAMGSEIGTENAEYITLFFTYAKGNETGLDIILNARRTSAGTNHPNRVWSASSGVQTGLTEKIRVTASGDYYSTWFIEGLDYVQFTQGGSNNDGTPTGTLAASYTLTG
jgi:hypothetical protein